MQRAVAAVSLMLLAASLPLVARADRPLTVSVPRGATVWTAIRCDPQKGFYLCASGGKLTLRDARGTCSYAFFSTSPPYGGEPQWSVRTTPQCPYQFVDDETLDILSRVPTPAPSAPDR